MHRGNRVLSDEEIGDYLEGRLDTASRDLIEKHLHNCSDCLGEVSSVGKALAFSDDVLFSRVPEQLLENVMALYPSKNTLYDAIVSLARDAIKLVDCSSLMKVSIPKPAFTLRGTHTSGSDVIVLSHSFDEVNVELAIEKISDLLCHIKVIVSEGADGKASANLRAGLFSGGRELASYHLDNGWTVFEEIEPGLYTISISRRSRIFGEISLKIE